MRIQLPFALLAIVLACSLASAPAHARARVFVASYGNDSNPCTFGSPCKTFQQAVDVVDAGGEVTAIDSAGFGPINITKSVSITSPTGVEAGIVPAAGGNAITIAAGAENEINLRGLIIEGSFTGATGIVFSSGGTLTIQDTVVRDFIDSGIGLTPNSSAHIAVSNTINNGGDGIFLQPSGGQPVFATFNRVEAYHNGLKGIGIFANNLGAANLIATITDRVAVYNTDGFYFMGSRSFLAAQYVRVNRSTTMANSNAGIHAEDGGTMYVSQTDLVESNITWIQDGSSCINTFGDNYVFDAAPCNVFPTK